MCKYIIIRTGYTVRIMGKDDLEGWCKKHSIVFIKAGNSTWSQMGFIHTFLIKSYVKSNDLDGIVVFELPNPTNDQDILNNRMDEYVYVLGDEHYCKFCKPRNIYKRIFDGRYAVAYVDTESG